MTGPMLRITVVELNGWFAVRLNIRGRVFAHVTHNEIDAWATVAELQGFMESLGCEFRDPTTEAR